LTAIAAQNRQPEYPAEVLSTYLYEARIEAGRFRNLAAARSIFETIFKTAPKFVPFSTFFCKNKTNHATVAVG
jgi:hypothetical protein